MRRLTFCLLLLSAFSAEAQVTLSNGAQISNGVKITASGAVCAIPSVILPDAMVGTAYGPGGAGVQIQTSNCAPPLVFTFTGSLPPGLGLSSTGLLSGIPTTPGAASFTIDVLDSLGNSAIFPVSFTITAISSVAPAPPDAALLNWNTLRSNTPSPGTVKTIGSGITGLCAPGGCTFNSPTLLSTAVASLSCGDTLEMQNTLYPVSGSLTFNKVCDQAHWITIERDLTDINFPPEGTRVTPCYSGIASIPGYPAYPCTSPQRDMPFIQKTTAGATINIFGTSYRFVGIEWGRTNGYDLDFGILAMANQNACTAPDLACMNAQPTFNIFDQNIIHGDAQRQTSHAIGLGGTRWVDVEQSYIYDINLTVSGGGGDAQPFAWGNGKNFTNSGWGKFVNNFEAASTMGNLFCGSFAEPLSPSTGFDGIPHDFWFSQDWLYKPITWDTQRGQTQGTALTIEGVTYPSAADQEFIMAPSAMQLQTGQSIVVQTWTANDSWSGIGRSPAGTTTLTCGSVDCGTQTTICQGCGANNPIGVGSGINISAQFVTTYTAPATVPTGGTVTLTRSFSTFDGRLATIGNNRTLTTSATFTIVSGSPTNQISLFPKASDLQIQPSYSDANFNVRQFELEFIAVKNFTSTTLAWKVDGVGSSGNVGGNATVGQLCGINSTTTCLAPGANDPQAFYWSGTQTGNHTISVTSATGTTDSSVINVTTTAPVVAWDAKANTSKNGFELKCGRKFLVEKMFIENDWGSEGNGNGQGGQLLLAHPFNQTNCPGNCNTSILSGSVNIGYGPFEIADGTFSYIKGLHHGAGMTVGGSQQTLGIRRVSLSNILCDDCSYKNNSHGFGLNNYFDTSFNGGPGTVYTWESATNPMASNISYTHITDVGDVPVNNTAHGGVFDVSENTAQAAVKPFGYTMQDSFFAATTSATFFDPNGGSTCNIAGGTGSNNTEARGMVPCFTPGGYIMNHLNLTDSTASPSVFLSSPIWQAAQASIGFVNAATGDYRLCKGLNNPAPPCAAASIFAAGQAQHASDGGDLGADESGIFTVELNVRNGLASPLTISTASLPDATSGSAYSTTLAVSGGTGPYQWTTPSGFIPSGAIDIMDYAAMPLTDRSNFHLTGTSVKYFRIDGGLLWWIKAASGHPSDMEMYDDRWVYQMGTEGDSSNNAVCIAAGFSSCFTDPFANKLYINPVPLWARYHQPGTMETKINPGPNKYIQTANCGADAQPAIDNQDVKGELSGPFTDITWQSSFGGSIPDNTPYLLAVKYTKGVAGVYQNREQYWLVKGFGQVQWCPSTWNGSTFVTGSCTRETTKTAGGAPTPNFGCKVPQLQVINGLPQGVTRVSAPPMNLASATGIIDGTPTLPGSYSFTVQVEDALGRLAQKTFTLVVH